MNIESHFPGDYPLFMEAGDQNPLMTRFDKMNRVGPQSRYNHATHKYDLGTCATIACGNVGGYAGTNFCKDCAMQIWYEVDSNTSESEKLAKRRGEYEDHLREQAWLDLQSERHATRREFATTPGIIYYLNVGGLVKIGYTSNLSQRMKQYPPNAELLAAHPGTLDTERHLHRKFFNHRAAGREWFTPCEEITRHIESVVNTYLQDRYTAELAA